MKITDSREFPVGMFVGEGMHATLAQRDAYGRIAHGYFEFSYRPAPQTADTFDDCLAMLVRGALTLFHVNAPFLRAKLRSCGGGSHIVDKNSQSE